MSKAKIYLANQAQNALIPMEETKYSQEEILQELVARYPDLLPGDQINSEYPRRWLLVNREMGIPDTETTGNRWSIDHLFLDQDAIPTFVECKRSQDTRIRREVVAQMLEYAANGIAYWPIDQLRQAASETAQSNGSTLDDSVLNLLEADDEGEVQLFWDQVEANLKAGIVRLLFVADEIPNELRRLVEFLNEKLNGIEVLAVEIKQFQGGGQEAWASRIIGQTEAIRKQKSGNTGRKYPRLDWNSFKLTLPDNLIEFCEQIIQEAESRGFSIGWGSANLIIKSPRSKKSFLYIRPEKIEFYWEYMNLTEQQMDDFQTKFADYGIQRSGRWSYYVVFQEQGQKDAWAIYQMVLDMLEQFDVQEVK